MTTPTPPSKEQVATAGEFGVAVIAMLNAFDNCDQGKPSSVARYEGALRTVKDMYDHILAAFDEMKKGYRIIEHIHLAQLKLYASQLEIAKRERDEAQAEVRRTLGALLPEGTDVIERVTKRSIAMRPVSTSTDSEVKDG